MGQCFWLERSKFPRSEHMCSDKSCLSTDGAFPPTHWWPLHKPPWDDTKKEHILLLFTRNQATMHWQEDYERHAILYTPRPQSAYFCLPGLFLSFINEALVVSSITTNDSFKFCALLSSSSFIIINYFLQQSNILSPFFPTAAWSSDILSIYLIPLLSHTHKNTLSHF